MKIIVFYRFFGSGYYPASSNCFNCSTLQLWKIYD